MHEFYASSTIVLTVNGVELVWHASGNLVLEGLKFTMTLYCMQTGSMQEY